jgi:hypothetical protein
MILRLGVAASLCILGIVASDMACAATRRRVALVHPDVELLRSVVISLSAWDIDIVTAEVSPPGRSLPEAERYAAQIAVQFQADAVSWISEGQGASVLWIYDATTNDIASRVLRDRPPFDEPTAAAVALSLKALLRSSTVAPEAERFGAVPPPAVPSSELRLEGEVGARVAPVQLAELRGALGIALWPRALAERLGFALTGSVGSGADVKEADFSARFTDFGLSTSLRTRIRVSSRFALEPSVGGTMHFMSLQGEENLLPEQVQVSANRLDGSLDLALAIFMHLGSVAVGACATLGYLPRYQQYFVEGQPVLTMLPVFLDATLRVSAGLL